MRNEQHCPQLSISVLYKNNVMILFPNLHMTVNQMSRFEIVRNIVFILHLFTLVSNFFSVISRVTITDEGPKLGERHQFLKLSPKTRAFHLFLRVSHRNCETLENRRECHVSSEMKRMSRVTVGLAH